VFNPSHAGTVMAGDQADSWTLLSDPKPQVGKIARVAH
jgi:hypothetical protein